MCLEIVLTKWSGTMRREYSTILLHIPFLLHSRLTMSNLTFLRQLISTNFLYYGHVLYVQKGERQSRAGETVSTEQKEEREEGDAHVSSLSG